MVADALDELRERAARLVPVSGRGVEQGDHVVLDVEGADAAGKQLFHRQNLLIEIGSNGPHPELTDPMRGMQPGETRSFTIDYPGDHPSDEMAGRHVAYKVTAREIKQKLRPELDDEFARELKLDSLEDLKRRVGDDLMARERRRALEAARRAALDQLLEANPGVPAPEALVDEELDRRLQDVARSLRMQGIDPSGAAVDWDEIRQKQREPAARTVRASLLLDAIADERKISLEPGMLDAAIADEAKRREQTPESLRAQLTKDGRLETLSAHLVREKVLDFMVGPSNT
jgi:trigger factor